MTIREAVTNGCACLKAAGVETFSLDASLLLAYALNTSRTALAANGIERLSEQAQAVFNDLIKRRLNGECVAYITGKKEFFNLDFIVNKNVLVPRPDTEILVEAALKILGTMNNSKKAAGSARALRVLDLCTGSGAVAISLKHEMPSIEAAATDISAEALTVAKINAKRILPEGSQINFYHGNLFKALPRKQTPFSLIVSNPPYIPSEKIKTLSAEVQNEPRFALDGGKSGLKIIKQIIKKSRSFLEKGGALLFEADPAQMEEISFLLEKRKFNNIKLYKDLSGQERVIGGFFDKKNK